MTSEMAQWVKKKKCLLPSLSLVLGHTWCKSKPTLAGCPLISKPIKESSKHLRVRTFQSSERSSRSHFLVSALGKGKWWLSLPSPRTLRTSAS